MKRTLLSAMLTLATAVAVGSPSAAATGSTQSTQVFDLFSDTRPNERKLIGDKA